MSKIFKSPLQTAVFQIITISSLVPLHYHAFSNPRQVPMAGVFNSV